MQPTRTRIARFAASFRDDRRGNVAVIFALSAIAILTAVGGAIDFSRVEAARRHMQDAADAGLLRAITLPAGTSDAERRSAADTEFHANFSGSDVHALSPNLEREVDGIATNQTYQVSAKVPSYFAGLMGRSDYDVNVIAKAQMLNQKYEIALVLDSTGSMAQSNKMVNLKSSVDSMLKDLLDPSGTNSNGTQVAVIPFNTQVRMATGNCVSDRSHTGTPAYDVSADSPNPAIPASQYGATTCQYPTLQPVRALTDNIASVRGFIPSLTPGGNTNITIGVQWGMEALSPSAPLAGGVDFGDTTAKKYMIVVTDGDNTANAWTSVTSQIDARTAIACANAKAKGITVFVVKVIEGNSNLLRGCATKPEYFYDLTNASQINGALSGIFETIKKTRLTM